MPGTSDKLWLRAFHAIVPGVVENFGPQIIVSQCGVDSHFAKTRLTDLSLTVDGQRAAIYAMRDLADRYSEGRWLAVGGGGYGIVDVVPRSWTHLIAAVTGADLAPGTVIDESWCAAAKAEARMLDETLRADPAGVMTDGGQTDYLPWDGDGGGPLMDGTTDAAQTRHGRHDHGDPACGLTRCVVSTRRIPVTDLPEPDRSDAAELTVAPDKRGPHDFPRHWIADVLAVDGGVVHLRPIVPEDADGLVAFHVSAVRTHPIPAVFRPVSRTCPPRDWPG